MSVFPWRVTYCFVKNDQFSKEIVDATFFFFKDLQKGCEIRSFQIMKKWKETMKIVRN